MRDPATYTSLSRTRFAEPEHGAAQAPLCDHLRRAGATGATGVAAAVVAGRCERQPHVDAAGGRGASVARLVGELHPDGQHAQ